MSGIISYGVYIPRYRIKLSEIADVWKKDAEEIVKALKVTEKSVPNFDEDTVTMAVESSMVALNMAGLKASQIQSLYIGSESHPYSVNPSSTIVGEALGVGNNYFAADFEFACKAATAALQVTTALIDSKKIEYGLVVGSDTAQAKPHDVLEYTAASAAASFIVGGRENEVVAKILDTVSFSSDTPDFWRRDGVRYPSHFGRFTGEPAYFSHIVSCAKILLSKTKSKPSDFSCCVFHMPNGKFPRVVAKKLGFSDAQLAPSLIVDEVGNPYSASSLLGLAKVLDIASPHEKIFFVSYGSGAGSDGFIFETTKNLIQKRKMGKSVSDQISQKRYVPYIDYLKKTHSI